MAEMEQNPASMQAYPEFNEDEDDGFLSDEDVQEQMKAMADQHWDQWLVTALPALNGRTPKTAATTPEGRERLEAILLDFSQKGGGSLQLFDPDVESLRRSLGLV